MLTKRWMDRSHFCNKQANQKVRLGHLAADNK
jgi:hypothetical protein